MILGFVSDGRNGDIDQTGENMCKNCSSTAHLLLCDGDVEPLGQLVGLLLPQGVPGVRHEDGGHAERLRVGVHQLPKGLCSV